MISGWSPAPAGLESGGRELGVRGPRLGVRAPDARSAGVAGPDSSLQAANASSRRAPGGWNVGRLHREGSALVDVARLVTVTL